MSWPLYQVDAFTDEPFAGNPATAHVLFIKGLAEAGQPVRFDSASGPLTARPGAGGAIWLDFPATPAAPVDPPDGLLEALGAGAGALDRPGPARLPGRAGGRGGRARPGPDVGRLGWLGSRGVIVTAAASGTAGYDFVSRYFGPGAGIDEDPVTGS